MDYANILTRAWRTIWRHKVLWIFGIFAGCTQGGGGGGGGSNFSQNVNTNGAEGGVDLPPAFQGMLDYLQEPSSWIYVALIVLAVVFVILLLTLLALFLGTIGRIGLVRGTQQAEINASSPPGEKITFGNLFRSGLRFFWRVFLLNLLLGIGWFIAIVSVAVILILSILGICLLLPYCCLLIPLGWLFAVYTEQANLALILEDLSIGDALIRAWKITRDHLGELIVMGLILVLGGLIVGLALAVPILILIIPLIGGIVIGGETAAATGAIVSAVLIVLYIPVLIFLNGILQAFIQSAWTLTFLELKNKEGNALIPRQPDQSAAGTAADA